MTEMSDDDRRMVLFTWAHFKPTLGTAGQFMLFDMRGTLTEDRLEDLDRRRVVNLMGMWSGKGRPVAHLEPTPEAVAQMVREGFLDAERNGTAKADAQMEGWAP